MQNMRIAFFLYEGLTTLDIIGPHDVLSRLPEAEAISVGTTTGPFMADTGVLGLTATHTIDQVDAADILVVPGGVCLLYTSPSPRDLSTSRMPSSA